MDPEEGGRAVGGRDAALVGWLELFFDLVVVVCAAVLADRLHEHPDWGGVGIFIVCFTAIWSIWISFVVYTDLANENTRIATLMIAAGVIGLMAAALGNLDERVNAFAIGFVVCRVMAARAASRTGRLLTAWPAVQLGGLTTPWIVSTRACGGGPGGASSSRRSCPSADGPSTSGTASARS